MIIPFVFSIIFITVSASIIFFVEYFIIKRSLNKHSGGRAQTHEEKIRLIKLIIATDLISIFFAFGLVSFANFSVEILEEVIIINFILSAIIIRSIIHIIVWPRYFPTLKTIKLFSLSLKGLFTILLVGAVLVFIALGLALLILYIGCPDGSICRF